MRSDMQMTNAENMTGNINFELTNIFTGEIEKVPLLALYPEYDKGETLNKLICFHYLIQKMK